jgi:hypothetical protein
VLGHLPRLSLDVVQVTISYMGARILEPLAQRRAYLQVGKGVGATTPMMRH